MSLCSRKNQASAVPTKIMSTRASPPRIGPSAASRLRSMPPASPSIRARPGNATKTRMTQQIGSSRSAIGRPIAMNCTNEMLVPVSSRIDAATTRLGGVPIIVAMPPIEAA